MLDVSGYVDWLAGGYTQPRLSKLAEQLTSWRVRVPTGVDGIPRAESLKGAIPAVPWPADTNILLTDGNQLIACPNDDSPRSASSIPPPEWIR
jgi:hypothetical protein